MCIKWVQSTEAEFLVAHRSGYMYLYNAELPCSSHPPHYAVTKQSGDVIVSHNKSKGKNPVCRWRISQTGINQFEFSPNLKLVAFASQDGFLRVVNYETYEVVGQMKMYFGGLLCLAWSPDGLYIAVGGEMDVIVIWSVVDRQPVAQGEAHRSWVNVIRFDSYLYGHAGRRLSVWNDDGGGGGGGGGGGSGDEDRDEGDEEEAVNHDGLLQPVKYRLGSVGQDAHLVLWDLFEEDLISGGVSSKSRSLLRAARQLSLHGRSFRTPTTVAAAAVANHIEDGNEELTATATATADSSSSNRVDGEDGSDSSGLVTLTASVMQELNAVSPLVNKRVSSDYVTDLIFREECAVIVSQDGAIRFWARPKCTVRLQRQFPFPFLEPLSLFS